jgi:hypothetical protein
MAVKIKKGSVVRTKRKMENKRGEVIEAGEVCKVLKKYNWVIIQSRETGVCIRTYELYDLEAVKS